MKSYQEAIDYAVDYYAYIKEGKADEIDRAEYSGVYRSIAFMYGEDLFKVKHDIADAYEKKQIS